MDKNELVETLKEHTLDIIWVFQEIVGCSCGVEFDYEALRTKEELYLEHLAEVIAIEVRTKE